MFFTVFRFHYTVGRILKLDGNQYGMLITQTKQTLENFTPWVY